MAHIELYIQIGVTAVCAIIYMMTYKYQKNKIEQLMGTLTSLKNHIESQESIINTYKQIMNVDDFMKHMEIKLENERYVTAKKTLETAKDILSEVILTDAHKVFYEHTRFIIELIIFLKLNPSQEDNFITQKLPLSKPNLTAILKGIRAEAETQKNQNAS